MALPLGSKAPDFELSSQSGDPVRLSDVAGRKIVVVFFYPRDNTAGCTVESCAFRDAYEVFREAGADVLGISRDPVRSHRAFAEEHELNFRILADTDGKVHERYRIKDTVPFLVRGRETFVIDRQRVIRHHFSSQLNPKKHVEEALRIVKRLAMEGAVT